MITPHSSFISVPFLLTRKEVSETLTDVKFIWVSALHVTVQERGIHEGFVTMLALKENTIEYTHQYILQAGSMIYRRVLEEGKFGEMIADGETESLCQRQEPKNMRRRTRKQQKMVWLVCVFSA